MFAPRHEQFGICEGAEYADLEFDASERLHLMQSGLPLCIFLESSEVVALKPPSPLYIFVPRVSYLPTLIDKCHEHFKPYIQPSFGQPTSPFFDFGGIPIDWRLPVGVAFDIISSLKKTSAIKRCGQSAPDSAEDDVEFAELASCGCDVQLPWCLTIHFHGSASGYLSGGANKLFEFQEYLGWASFESFFINSLKQATYIINGSATPFQRLAKAAEMQLLTASRTGSIAQFLEGCSEFLPAISPKHFRRIPIRLYICGPPCIQLSLSFPCFRTNGMHGEKHIEDNGSYPRFEFPSLGDAEMVQPRKLLEATSSTSAKIREAVEAGVRSPSTLGDLLHHVLPQLFPKMTTMGEPRTRRESIPRGYSAENTDSDAKNAYTARKQHIAKVIEEPGCSIGRRSCSVVVHGIQPLLQTPLFWLAATAPQLDMFLHIVVFVDKALMGSS